MFEEYYPIVAIAYGTFGLAFGVFLWWRTQRRIDRTKSAIEIQVANAVTDISERVDTKLGGFDLTALSAKLDEIDDAIPDFDLDELGKKVSAEVEMAIKREQANASRAITAQLGESGIEGMLEEQADLVQAAIPPSFVQAQKVAQMKPTKKFAAEHPIEAMAYELGKLGLMRQLEGAGFYDVQGIAEAVTNGGIQSLRRRGSSVESGGAHNPGAVR